MSKLFKRLSAFVLLCLPVCVWGAEASASVVQQRLLDIFEQRKGAVVKIFSVARVREDLSQKIVSVGTAFFVDKKGHLLANANVVAGSERMWIEHEGRPYMTRLVGLDEVTNLALVKAEELPKDFSVVELGKSAEDLPVTTLLLGVTCKLGFEPSPSFGMLSGRNAQYGNQILPTTYLRTDIPSDGAEGGAPIFDLDGRFVGMIVISLPEIRSSFLLPAAAVERVRAALMQGGRMQYARLGFSARQRVDANENLQVCLDEIDDDGPARQAGLEKGDVLVQVGERTITRHEDLREAVFFALPGKALLVKAQREGKVRSFQLKASARDSQELTLSSPAAAPEVP